MILFWMLLILFVGGFAAWAAERVSVAACRWVALLAVTTFGGLALQLWGRAPIAAPDPGCWCAMVDLPWIPQLGIHVRLMADGISLLLLLLTAVAGLLAVGVSWHNPTTRVGFFHANLLWTLAGVAGVFMAMDMVLFYVFWEVMLIPLYFLIAIWGREQRRYAAIKFFIYTQGASLVLLLGILGLFLLHDSRTGVASFNYFDLVREPLSPSLGFWLMTAFFAGFAVKLPVLPVHGWLADAHAQAPVAGSVFLAGLALKVGAYGMLRFAIPLFPSAALAFTPVAMALAVAGILYGAVLAFGQRDLKRLIACSSISHMGFVLLGLFSWNTLALQGALVVMLAHGVSTAALFALAGMVHDRTGTYDLARLGGLWSKLPRLGGVAMVLAMASLGLPGLANFVGEFLVLLGAWQSHPVFAVCAAAGLVPATAYALRLIQAVFHGPAAATQTALPRPDANRRELAILVGCVALLFWIGLCPGPVLRLSAPAVEALQSIGTTPPMAVHVDHRTPRTGAIIVSALAGPKRSPAEELTHDPD